MCLTGKLIGNLQTNGRTQCKNNQQIRYFQLYLELWPPCLRITLANFFCFEFRLEFRLQFIVIRFSLNIYMTQLVIPPCQLAGHQFTRPLRPVKGWRSTAAKSILTCSRLIAAQCVEAPLRCAVFCHTSYSTVLPADSQFIAELVRTDYHSEENPTNCLPFERLAISNFRPKKCEYNRTCTRIDDNNSAPFVR